jgi:acyl-CoA thioesterase I
MKNTFRDSTPWMLFLLLILPTGCRDSTPVIFPLSPDAVILAFGDSLTSGTGAKESDSYPSILEQLTGFTAVNGGVPGEITAQGLLRLPELLARHQPELVILCHGGNDILRHIDSGITAGNLRQMIEMSRSHGAQVLLVGVPRPGFVLRPADFYKELAAEFGIPYEEKIISKILSTQSEKSDAIHPNGAGYRRLAETLAIAIGEGKRDY